MLLVTRYKEELPINEKQDLIQWHPAFCSATELEFHENRDDLEFHLEYLLAKKPLQADLLIHRKSMDTPIYNEIGHIFRTYNILEYKSPNDALSIDDFYKAISYASLYKSSGKVINQIPSNEVTLSFFRERYPRELFAALRREGMTVWNYMPGIYYIEGNLFPTQIIVIRLLSEQAHESLQMLSSNLKRETAQAFLKKTEQFTTQGERNLIDSVLQVSISANQQLYNTLRGDDIMCCDALRELMQDVIDKEVDEAVSEAVNETIIKSLSNLITNLHLSAEQAMNALSIPVTDQPKYLAKL